MIHLTLLFTLFQMIVGQTFMDLPEYFPPNALPDSLNPPPINQHLHYRNKANNQFRRDSNDQQQAMLKKFYEIDLIKNYSLPFTDWSSIWFEYEEMSVKNQTALIKELREKQRSIEMILIKLCEDVCLRDFCQMPIDQQTTTILPRNRDSWLRFAEMKFEEFPLKIKKLTILQLKIDRFRAQNSLSMMVNELCPYSKYFDEPTNRPNGGSENPKLITNNPEIRNNLDGKPIEVN